MPPEFLDEGNKLGDGGDITTTGSGARGGASQPCKPGGVADDDDLRTETFSNARGWTAVRVTHAGSGTVAERVRSATLKSAVEAQRECVTEIRQRLADGVSSVPAVAESDAEHAPSPVTRAEFDALAARVDRLERALNEG
jgi:hypothetical protein